METVNHVLGSHKGSRIKELKVDTFNTKGDDYYKEWFEFALTKEAMNHIKGSGLGQTSNQILLHGLKYLKELSLLRIRLTDQDFDLLVNNCPVLESLSIHSSVLEHVSIVGHSKLKHLHLFQPWSLRSLEIRDAINLVSFKCKCAMGCWIDNVSCSLVIFRSLLNLVIVNVGLMFHMLSSS